MPKSTFDTGHPLGLKAPPDASVAMRLPFLRLASAAVYRAVQDLRDERDAVALDALMWLVLDPLPKWVLELLEFETETPAALISKGLETVPGRKPGRKQYKKYKHLEVTNES